MSVVSAYKLLEGGPGRDNNGKVHGFNEIDRKNHRNLLYTRVKEQVVEFDSMLPYDKYWVFNLLMKQIINHEF